MSNILKNQTKEMFVKIAYKYIGKPYIYGGDDPMKGFDCSGLVVECLKSIGRIKLDSDYTADGLYRELLRTGAEILRYPKRGALAFWINTTTDRFYHVAICLNSLFCITADGGGSQILTIQDAIDKNAFIKVRRNDHRIAEPVYLYAVKEE